MTQDLPLSGTTVTLFGNRDALDHALNAELDRRGCSTHSVTIPTGWLQSTTHAVLRLNSRSGDSALQELVEQPGPPSHVVAVCETPTDPAISARIEDLCRRCGASHDVSLIWYDSSRPAEPALTDQLPSHPTAQALAVTIVDEVVSHGHDATEPSFAAQTYDPTVRPGHG